MARWESEPRDEPWLSAIVQWLAYLAVAAAVVIVLLGLTAVETPR